MKKYIKIIVFLILTLLVLTGLYVSFTKKIDERIQRMEEDKYKEKAMKHSLMNPTPENKKKIQEIEHSLFNKPEQLNLNTLIESYNSTDSIAVKSIIIKSIAREFINDSKAVSFFKEKFPGELVLVQQIMIKDLKHTDHRNVADIFRYIIGLNLNLSDQVYVDLLVFIASKVDKVNPDRKVYIEKIKSLVPALQNRILARTLHSLLKITEGDPEVVAMTNKRLVGTRNMEMFVLAMTELAKYDNSWILENQSFLLEHPGEHVRAFYIQNMKNFCPENFQNILAEGVVDKSKVVVNITMQELGNYGEVGKKIFLMKRSEIPIDEKRKESFDRMFQRSDILLKKSCQR